MKPKANEDSQENKESAPEQVSAAGSDSGTTTTPATPVAENQVSAEEHKALIERLNKQEQKFEQLLEKFNSVQPYVPQITYQQPPVIQTEVERLKVQYQDQYERATLLPEEEQVIYFCYLWAYPAMGYLHEKTRKFINPPFLKESNGTYKYKPLEFAFSHTRKFQDPIDGERPVPYSVFRATYKEEVEFLESHPAYGELFYRLSGNKVKNDDLKMVALRNSIATQVNGMSPNMLGQNCMAEKIEFDPTDLGEARKLLIESLIRKQSQNIDNSQHDKIVSMFANGGRTMHQDGQVIAVEDMNSLSRVKVVAKS